ncbi:protein ARK2N-like isoform X3 [Acipenser ruthenus]|uniref:protein ARK2N-like isoform X3 n=1 Tax=Acipenser ruthenus TaxID=7906 RepID=UPI0015608487|nr:protein ARK2N-like isoform X3 [Acipenser ruthenus]
MKMADAEKSEELVNSKTPPETPLEVAAGDKTLKTETSPSEKEGDGLLQTDPGLLSAMPCLLMELRRDSPESQQASTESEKQTPSRTYESDSSNHCMLSPSSSGHLADSDTLSSAEENGAPRAGASCAAEGGDSNSGAGGVVVAGGRKSRRSRSESEMSSTTSMAAKKNRWQATGADKQNGRLAKVKGHRSQKHKERIRLLRQKREAAARKKYNLLQDSSTSDSDLTCDSSTSSSDDDKEVSGSGKTITGNIPEHSPPPQDSNENPMDNEDNLSSEPLPTNSTPRHICRTTGRKRKRADGISSVGELVQTMQESDETYIRFMQQQMQADQDFRERQMEFDLEQRERESKASNALNVQFLAVLGRLGEALLSQRQDLPVD